MAKFLVLWQLDQARTPVDATERGTTWTMFLETVKQQIEQGIMTDWGAFPAESRGFSLAEGTAEEVTAALMPYIPYVMFEVHPVISVDAMVDIIKTTTGT